MFPFYCALVENGVGAISPGSSAFEVWCEVDVDVEVDVAERKTPQIDRGVSAKKHVQGLKIRHQLQPSATPTPTDRSVG
jgi:hypothetical protein